MKRPYMPNQTILRADGIIEHHALATPWPFRWAERRLNLRAAGHGARLVNNEDLNALRTTSISDRQAHEPCFCQNFNMTDEATCPFCHDTGTIPAGSKPDLAALLKQS